MRGIDLQAATTSQLVERFLELALAQFEAEVYGKIATYNRLYDKMVMLRAELKGRPGDQRHALVPLLEHENPQVRLMAAETVLALAPIAARKTLQTLWDQQEFPQAAYAMGTLRALDSGERKPT